MRFDEIAILHFRFVLPILLHAHTHVLVIIFACTHARLLYPLVIAISHALYKNIPSPHYKILFLPSSLDRYELPFNVTTPGQYYVELIWWRENYNGIRDLEPPAPGARASPPIHLDKPLGDNTAITLGAEADGTVSSDRIAEALRRLCCR